jgi:hypothetical protein
MLSLSFSNGFSVPTFDGGKMLERLKSFEETAQSFNDLKKEYINKYVGQIQGASNYADALNNAFANQIIRNNQSRLSAENQRLKMSSEPVDICSNYSLSSALNDLACGSLSSLSDSSVNFIKKSQNHELVSKDATSHKVSDINTIAVTTLPVIDKTDKNNDVMTQVNHLQEQAYKSTVHTLTQSIKSDHKNLYNPLTNQTADDFGTDEIKKIQETYNKSQLYRKMAVMLAQKNYAAMLAYKHQLQSELAMAMQLLQRVDQQFN